MRTFTLIPMLLAATLCGSSAMANDQRDALSQSLRQLIEALQAVEADIRNSPSFGSEAEQVGGYRHMLRMAPDHFEAHYGLSRALLEVGGRVQALAHLRRFCAAVEAIAEPMRDPSLQARLDSALTFVEQLEAEVDA